MRKPSFFSLWPTPKHFGPVKSYLCVILALFLIMGCAALQNIGQPQLQTYMFNYNGQEYSTLLPKEVPLPPDTAFLNPSWYPGWGALYAMHVSYFVRDEDPIASFWFTKNLGVVGLVYHFTTDGKENHDCYIYVKGLPVKISIDRFNTAMREWSRDQRAKDISFFIPIAEESIPTFKQIKNWEQIDVQEAVCGPFLFFVNPKPSKYAVAYLHYHGKLLVQWGFLDGDKSRNFVLEADDVTWKEYGPIPALDKTLKGFLSKVPESSI